MNYALSNDPVDEYPEEIAHKIRSGHATCLKYNRKGDYLASGRTNGTVVVWDLDTMGIARKLRGHCMPVSSLNWSNCGRYLLSACQGWLAVLWDLHDGSQHRQVRFSAPVYMAELNPSNHLQFVACLFEDNPYLVDMDADVAVLHRLPSVPKREVVDVTAAAAERQAKEDAKNMTTATIFSHTGNHIITGTSKGRINMIDTETREIVFSEKICNTVITTLKTAGNCKSLLVNSQDRIIRTFKFPDQVYGDLNINAISLLPVHRFQDVVNRMSWNHTTFSYTGDHVIASTYTNHELYLWECHRGSLARMLVGPKEELGMIDWHPNRAVFAVYGLETGTIYIWAVNISQKWSALAPDFVEVEENVEYKENEDEFDTYPQEDIHKQRLEAEDEIIDILPDGHQAAQNEFRMPILFDIGETDSEEELVEVSTGTMRRRTPGEDEDEQDKASALAKKAAKKGKKR